MGIARSEGIIRWEGFELDIRTAELRNSNGNTVRLSEQPLRILVALVERPGELVLREDLRKRLWPNDTVVEFEHSISAAMNRLRQALGDSAENPKFIETLARRGYRWKTPVEWEQPQAAPTPAQPFDSNLIGKRVSHYRVLEILGGGGMGVVYKAEDIKLGRRVALKFLPEELAGDAAALQRFEREARAASALNHPNICTIHAVEEHEGQPFIVMELLEGRTLRDMISQVGAATFPAEKAPSQLKTLLEIAVQIANGLEAAHQKGIIHRDIKPANIFVTNHRQVKILDFGLAKLHEFESVEASPQASGQPSPTAGWNPLLTLTRTGVTIGTAAYMSPEQVRGERVDLRTDLFSFGLVLYEMATRQRAFAGDTAAVLHDAILNLTPAPVRTLNPEIPGKLEAIINNAIEKDVRRRYQTASEMRLDLEEFDVPRSSGHSGQENTGEAFLKQSHPAGRRNVLAVALAFLMVALIVIPVEFARHGSPNLANVKFTKVTDTGGATDVAISPNGRFIVYSLRSGEDESLRLRLTSTRSDIEILSRGPGFHGLTFSPKNDYVYFVRSDPNEPYLKDLYSVPVFGGPVRRIIVRIDGPAAFSPDGRQFAFERSLFRRNVIELRVANADGSGEHLIATIQNGDSGLFQPGPSWSRDGRTIVCPFRILGNDIRWILAAVSMPGYAVREIYSDTAGLGRPVWLNGRSLLIPRYEAADGRSQLWTISYPEGNARRFTNDLTDYDAPLDVTSDGQTAVAIATTIVSNIWEAPGDDLARARQVTFGPLALLNVAETSARRVLSSGVDGRVWTVEPDGKREAVSDLHDVGWIRACGDSMLFTSSDAKAVTLKRLASDNPRPLTLFSGDLSYPGCSQDGRFAYYVNGHRPQKIWRLSTDGGSPVPIADGMGEGINGWLDVSPDGKLLSFPFAQYHPAAWKLAVIPASGGPAIETFDVPGGTTRALWAPDGTGLQYLVTQDGATNIWEQSLRGGQPTKLTHFASDQIFDFSWSTDRRRLFLTRGDVTSDVVLLSNIR